MSRSEGQDLPTPLRLTDFRTYLDSYDPYKRQYVLTGISWGFSIGYNGITAKIKAINAPSVKEYEVQIQILIYKESRAPFTNPFQTHTYFTRFNQAQTTFR